MIDAVEPISRSVFTPLTTAPPVATTEPNTVVAGAAATAMTKPAPVPAVFNTFAVLYALFAASAIFVYSSPFKMF